MNTSFLHPCADAAGRSCAGNPRNFLLTHLWLPLLALLLLGSGLVAGHVDMRLADFLYHAEGGRWQLKDAWLTSGLLHLGGRRLDIAAGLSVAALCIGGWRHPRFRWPLLYLLLAVIAANCVVALLKTWTHMDCPWDLSRYGGTRPYLGLLQPRPAGLPRATGCFPAGHAGAGYAWLALYFFARETFPRWRWPALAAGLAAGLAFGLAQQLRGAHFASHDVAALAACWLVALGLYLVLLRPRMRAAARSAEAMR